MFSALQIIHRMIGIAHETACLMGTEQGNESNPPNYQNNSDSQESMGKTIPECARKRTELLQSEIPGSTRVARPSSSR
jgi:hypothetical protein